MSSHHNVRRCQVCGETATRCGQWRYCWSCYRAAQSLIARARYAVSKAIRQGLLQPASTQYCVDCGGFAFGYEHRDYERPLEVDPICRTCNHKRGSAKQLSPGFRVASPSLVDRTRTQQRPGAIDDIERDPHYKDGRDGEQRYEEDSAHTVSLFFCPLRSTLANPKD